ncbi:MAG: hypothetical protein GDA49_12320 [Rhodospirillales bacterium]|nr:hypothetical protein [Rhodospirillales bacterium]
MVSASLNRGFWMSLQPDGPDRVRVRVLWGGTIAAPLWPEEGQERAAMRVEIKETFDRVNMEDRTILESIARSLKSDHVVSGRLGEKERTIWEFQRLLACALGVPVPAAPIPAE